MGKAIRMIGVSLLIAATAVLYQNCGEGFQSAELQSLGNASVNIIMAPQATKAFVGESVTLNIVARSIDNSVTRFQWKKDGNIILGETAQELQLANLTAESAGLYSVSIYTTNLSPLIADSEIETQAVSLTVEAAPIENIAASVVSSTGSKYITDGGDGYLRIQADGYPRPSIQWWKDGSPLIGETKEYILIENANLGDTGAYRAEVSNADGIVMSPYALVSVGQEQVAPQLMEITGTQRLAQATPIKLNAQFVGLENPTYQWFKDDVALIGATQNTLEILNATSLNSGNYKIIATNSSGNAEGIVSVTVVDGLALVTALTNQMVPVNQNVLFNVVIAGTVDKYEWFKDNVLIVGADTATLTLNAVTVANTGTYKVRATNIAGAIESMATLTVVAPPVIVQGLQNQASAELSNATLSVQATGIGLTYKWFKNNVEIVGATQSALNLMNLTHLDQATYRVDIINLAAVVPSSASLTVDLELVGETLYARDCASCHGALNASLKYNRSFAQIKAAMMNVPAMQVRFLTGNQVNRTDAQIQAVAVALAVTPPVIVTQPLSQTVAVGSTVSLSVVANGKYLRYQWKKDNVDINGATNNVLEFQSIQMSDSGSYTVTVTNAAGSVVSNAAVLNIGVGPTIQVQPATNIVKIATENFTFNVVAIGDNLTYQWKKSGVALPGETANSLALNNLNVTDTGAYTVVVTNQFGSVESEDGNLTVHQPPIITNSLEDAVIENSSRHTFAFIFSHSDASTSKFTFEWFRDNVLLDPQPLTFCGGSVGAAPPYSRSCFANIDFLKFADAGVYKVRITNEAGASVEDSMTLTVPVPKLELPWGLAFSPQSETKIYVTDRSHDAIFLVDTVTKTRTLISSEKYGVGSGTGIRSPYAIRLIAAGTHAYVLDGSIFTSKIVKVDLTNGNRISVSGEGVGSGPEFESPRDMALNAAGTHAYVLHSEGVVGNSGIIRVDLVTGVRDRITGAGLGSGPDIVGPSGIALNTAGTEAYVVQSSNLSGVRIIKVVLATGVRSIVAGAGNGNGPSLDGPHKIGLNPTGTLAFVTDMAKEIVVEVDLSTRKRRIVSGGGVGVGPAIPQSRGIIVNAAGTHAYVTESMSKSLIQIQLSTGNRVTIFD